MPIQQHRALQKIILKKIKKLLTTPLSYVIIRKKWGFFMPKIIERKSNEKN